MPLSSHSVGTCPEPRSHATCQETFGHSRLGSLSQSAKKKEKKEEEQEAQAGNEWSNILPKGKKHHHMSLAIQPLH